MVRPAAFYNPDFDESLFHADHIALVRYFLNLIHWKTCCRKTNDSGYVQLHARIIRKIIPEDAFAQIRWKLVEAGIIECDNEVIFGKKARGYQLAEGYRDTKRIVCNNVVLNRKIARVQHAERGPQYPVHRWLEKQFDKLEVDMDLATRIVARLKPKRGVKAAKYRHGLLETLRRIQHGDNWLICDKYGRVHTPVTALKRELRACLHVDGEPLVCIDLVNAQPLLLGVLTRKWLGASKKSQQELLASRPKQRLYDARNLGSKPIGKLPADLRRYMRACETGRFYASLMTKEERKKDASWIRDFKKRFFRVLFGTGRAHPKYGNEVRERFAKTYPTVWRVLRKLKRKEYQRSSHLLQNREATFVIGKVCGRIMRERQRLFVLTVHDAILTTRDGSQYVQRVIREEAEKLGMNCRIQVKELVP